MATYDKVRILVVGDAGVGKTSLVHLMCHGEPIGKPSWTIGCSVEVKLHEYKAGTPAEKTYFVELWDIGGFSSHINSRGVFYQPVHGIILVHDLSNRKSHQNLRKWLSEVLSRDKGGTSNGYDDYDPEQFVGNQIPILVVGTKADQTDGVSGRGLRSSSIAEECGADEINVDCHHVRYLAPGSSNSVKLSKFFDKVIARRFGSRDRDMGKVIERRYYSRESNTAQGMQYASTSHYQDRRRPFSQNYGKTSHVD